MPLLDVRIDHLKMVEDILQQHVPEREVWAFGSRAKWLAKEYSDLDLCILGEKPLSFRTLGLLEEAFEDSNLPYKVDIVDWATTSESFRKIIEKDKVVVQEGKSGVMTADWPITTLGAICSNQNGAIQTGPFGSQLHTSDYKETGIPVVMPTNISDGGIVEDGIARISEEDVNRLSQHILRMGDIVFSRRGDVTKNALIRSREVGWFCGTGCLKVRLGDESLASAEFISNYLRLPEVKEWLIRHAVGATMPNLNAGILSAVPICLPPINEQKRISKILGDLDSKISINRKTNQTLEQIAQAIFKSWFVDFDPVKAKIAALNSLSLGERAGVRAHELAERAAMSVISGKDETQLAQLKIQDADAYQQLAQTAALFPAVMQESELGEIPEGWRISSIGEIAKAKGGFAFKSNDFTTEGNEVVKIKNITGDGRVDLDDCDYINNEVANKNYKFKLSDGDLLMAMTGATVGKVGIVATSGKSAYVNQRVAKFESDEFGKKISWFLYPCIQRQLVFDSIVGAAQGSAQPNISSSGIEGTEIVLPTSALINYYCDKLDPYFQRWISNNIESRLLSELRDSLLPKLLSGEITLTDTKSPHPNPLPKGEGTGAC